MRDYSMLDLFRQEVETQVTNLKQSLSILKRQPSLVSELESATRSLHAIAGSAQIVEIEAAANLAEAVKTGLIAVQANSIDLTAAQIDQLLHAGDLLVGISNASVGDLERWLAEHSEDLLSTQSAIAKLASSRNDIPQRLEPALRTDDSTDSSEPTPVVSPPTSSLILEDSSMLELFRLEVEAQATILTNGLIALETQPQSAQELEVLMRAAHSVKGAARIVGLDAAVQLAHVTEDCFVAAQNKTITLGADQIDVLLRGVDLLQSLSLVNDTLSPGTLAENEAEIASICALIAAMQTPGAALLKPQVNTQIRPAAMPAAPNSVNVNSAPVPQPEPDKLAVSPPPAMEAPVVQMREPGVLSDRASAVVDASEATVNVQDRVVRVSADNLNRMMGTGRRVDD